ncbi:hypothetical protein D7S89_18820 [Trinickia fusca]|uniref:PASTA domain-containing protein n=1 Tax=Trinickia fusca TaxID=2419777 RepID=A0A494XBY0_9BURK|nr:hypothetical protein D7S89_18820 [Trinickia fusca]
MAFTAFASAAPAATPNTASDIPGATLTALANLPRSPESGSPDEYCKGSSPVSAAAKLVAGRGWIVTSEAQLGQYQVVTFASGFEPGTSGMCFTRNGRLAVFGRAGLIALAYTGRAAELQLGNVELLESGALMISAGDGVGAPIGELHEVNGGFRLTRVAAERTFCNGRAVVPNVYGKSIKDARKILIARGWKPKRPAEAWGEFDGAADLAKHGIVEAETCSGTGLGDCWFNYNGPSGILRVTTIGEDRERGNDDTIVGYDVKCRAK